MKKITTFLVVILFSVLANAQTDTVKYNEILNNPNSIPNFSLHLTPVYLESSDLNLFTIGFEGGFNATLFNKFKINSSYKRLYYSLDSYKETYQVHQYVGTTAQYFENIEISEKLNPAYTFEVGGAFIYSDNTASKKVLINLASQQTGNVIINTVTAVSTNVRKRNSFRIGYFQHQNIINFSESLAFGKEDYFLTESGDKIYPKGIAYHNINYDSLEATLYKYYSQTNPWQTNSKTNGIYLGIETEFITNLIIETETFGKKTNRTSTTLYFDVYYGKTAVGDLIAFDSNPSGTTYTEEVGVNKVYYTPVIGKGEDELHVNKFGFRFGIEKKGIMPSKFVKWQDRDGTTSLLSSSYKIEFGLRPGIKYGMYGLITYSILLNK